MNFDLDTLPNGATHYDGANAVYYRGDGANDTVRLPVGKAVDRISPQMFWGYSIADIALVMFAAAIPSGELVTITLRDAE